jgi:hypothetical protein
VVVAIYFFVPQPVPVPAKQRSQATSYFCWQPFNHIEIVVLDIGNNFKAGSWGSGQDTASVTLSGLAVASLEYPRLLQR